MPTHHRHVPVPVCTFSILWNFHTNPYQTSETTSCNNKVTVPVKPQERQITRCRARGGQHARPSYKHCKACAKHAHAPRPRVHTGLHDFHLVELSYQPVLSQWTTSCNNRVTVPVKPPERQITSCMARGGQHARPSHRHCKACAKHAHAA